MFIDAPAACLLPVLMIFGSAVQAQDDVAACSLIRINQHYWLKENNGVTPCTQQHAAAKGTKAHFHATKLPADHQKRMLGLGSCLPPTIRETAAWVMVGMEGCSSR